MLLIIPFGQTKQEFEVPDGSLLFTEAIRKIPALRDIRKGVLEQLDHPVGSPPLREMASGKNNM